MGAESDYQLALSHSELVFQDLMDAGFVPHMKKCCWSPVQSLIWLGILIDLSEAVLQVPQTKVDKVLCEIDKVLSRPRVTARKLARIVGQIGSMYLVVGNITRLMLKFCHIRIASAPAWDYYFNLHAQELQELQFWRFNLSKLNSRPIVQSSVCSRVVYSDDGGLGCGGFVVNIQDSTVHRT